METSRCGLCEMNVGVGEIGDGGFGLGFVI